MKRKTVIYIAGPFRGKNSWEMECNIRRAEERALEAWNIPGVAVICPHTNTRFFQGAAPDEVWLDGDLEILLRCDVVLLTPDWQRSSGARAEVDFARQNNIPVFETIEQVRLWLKRSTKLKRKKRSPKPKPYCLGCGRDYPCPSDCPAGVAVSYQEAGLYT